MKVRAMPTLLTDLPNKSVISTLYFHLLATWNERDVRAYAALFAEDAAVVGFDGSQMNGRAEIEATVGQIFADHMTAVYVGKVREVKLVAPGVALLRAVCGMVPRGQTDINPAVNAVQSLLATQPGDHWQITLFQNTPAQFHGRPDLAEALTSELRALL